MSNDIRELQRRLDRISTGGNFKAAAQSIGPLLSHVRDFVEMVREEQNLAGQVSGIKSDIEHLTEEDPEYQQKQTELRDLLATAERAKRHISDKRSELRRVRSELQEISNEIGRII